MSHLLPDGGPPTIADFVAALRDGRLGPTPTVVVDDAHLLDDASAALVLAIATTGVAPLLLTLRSNEPAPDAIVALWKERHLDRVDLQPLSEEEVERLVDDLLGAPSHAQAYEWIHRLAEGNPLYVTELVDDARRTGRLELRDGRWHLAEGQRAARAPARPARRAHRLGDRHGPGGARAPRRWARRCRSCSSRTSSPAPGSRSSSAPGSRSCATTRTRARSSTSPTRCTASSCATTCPRPPPAASGGTWPAPSPARHRRPGGPAPHRPPAARVGPGRRGALPRGELDRPRATAPRTSPGGWPRPSRRRCRPRSTVARASPAPAASPRSTRCSRRSRPRRRPPPPRSRRPTWRPRVRCLLRGPGDQPDQADPLIGRAEEWHDDADWRALIADDPLLDRRAQRRLRRPRAPWSSLARRPDREPGAAPARCSWPTASALTRLGRVDDYDAVMAEVAQLTEQLGGRASTPR